MALAREQAASPRKRRTGARDKGSYVQSLEKGLKVLEAFKPNGPALNIAQAAAISGLDRAGARRILLTLQHLGYLKINGRHFSLTPRVLTLSQSYLECLPFWRLAQSVLEELSQSLDETASIGVLDQQDIVYVLRVPARRLITFNPNIGARIPAHLSSIGHVVLAGLSDKELKEYLDQTHLRSYTPHTIRSKTELYRQICKVRENGWAYVRQQYESNACGVAVGISDSAGRVVAGLNVSQIVDSAPDEAVIKRILPRLRVAAERLSGLDIAS